MIGAIATILGVFVAIVGIVIAATSSGGGQAQPGPTVSTPVSGTEASGDSTPSTPVSGTEASGDSTPSTTVARTTPTGPVESPTFSLAAITAALRPNSVYGKYLLGEISSRDQVRFSGILDPADPEVCKQTVESNKLTVGQFKTVEIYRNGWSGHGGTAAMSFSDGGASEWYAQAAEIIRSCSGVALDPSPGVAGSDESLAVHVPRAADSWSGDADDAIDLVIFRIGNTIWMAAFETSWPEQQTAVRALASDLAAAASSVSNT